MRPSTKLQLALIINRTLLYIHVDANVVLGVNGPLHVSQMGLFLFNGRVSRGVNLMLIVKGLAM